MHPFSYARPSTLADALAMFEEHGPDARLLAGGTDLIIRLRDGTAHPTVVIDVKRIPELCPAIEESDGFLRIGAGTVMTDICADERVRRHFPALAEAASVVGSVQIRNRATLAGNICNASPAADGAPPLLVYGAVVCAAGLDGVHRIPIGEFFVRSGVTTLPWGEIVTAIELPMPTRPMGSVHVRRTRRRGHDLASVTLSCGVDDAGVTRLAYGSVGPRPLLVTDESGTLADRGASDEAKAAVFERMFADASPSPRSMRAGPEYRLAMLRVLGARALGTAIGRLAEG
jgi:CO/xanthine dehydrogenase FAD-binding subunit